MPELTRCPRCGDKLDRSAKFFPPAVLCRCRRCKRYAIEGVDEWVDFGPEAMDRLRKLATPIMIADSEQDDPRWGT